MVIINLTKLTVFKNLCKILDSALRIKSRLDYALRIKSPKSQDLVLKNSQSKGAGILQRTKQKSLFGAGSKLAYIAPLCELEKWMLPPARRGF